MIKVLSVHWGFSIGGVAQYAAILERVGDVADIEMSTVCVLNRRRHIDEQTLARLGRLTVIERTGPWDIRWLGKLRVLINDTAPDLVVTHGFNGHFAVFAASLFGRGATRFIASYHGEYHPPTRLKKVVAGAYNGFTEFYMRNVATSVASVADYCKKFLVARRVDPEKIHVIHNGISGVVENADADALRHELGLPEDALVIGVISRLDPEKGLNYLLEAFQGVLKCHPEAFLVIIGTGAQEEQLAQLSIDLGISDRVEFSGFKAGASKYLSVLDVFALPSLAEYHSIGLLEAMRAGKAIVSTDVGGNTESVRNEKEGLVVEAGNARQLEQALNTMLDSKQLRQHYGQAARARFDEEFLVEVMVKRSAEWIVAAAEGAAQ